MNFKIIEADDGVDIIKLVTYDQKYGNRIKIIMTDENMEYLQGTKAISILRELESFGKIKSTFIVSVTAFSDDFTKNEIIQKGANLVIAKPFSQYHIEEIIKAYESYFCD